jgi:hypothetical protein
MKRFVLVLVSLFAFVAMAVEAPKAEEKETVVQKTKEGGLAVGHAAKKGGLVVGHAAKKGGLAVGHGAKKAGKAVVKKVKE